MRYSVSLVILVIGVVCAMCAPVKAGAQTSLKADPSTWTNPSGKYSVAIDEVSLPEHTIFYPEDLSAFPKKDKLPILVMSGPGCVKSSAPFRAFFTEVASHGYLFIISGPLTGGMQQGNTQNTKQDMLDAIDWAFKENQRPDSPFYGKIDTDNVCAMGQSCGGIQALDIMSDPRITLLNLFNSGLFANSQNAVASMGDVMQKPKAEVFDSIRVPIAYFVGGTDMARPNATDDFNYIHKVPVVLAVREIEGDAHAGTFRETNGGSFAKASIAWLDWKAKGIKKAKKFFVGAKNMFDNDPLWIEYKTRNLK